MLASYELFFSSLKRRIMSNTFAGIARLRKQKMPKR